MTNLPTCPVDGSLLRQTSEPQGADDFDVVYRCENCPRNWCPDDLPDMTVYDVWLEGNEADLKKEWDTKTPEEQAEDGEDFENFCAWAYRDGYGL